MRKFKIRLVEDRDDWGDWDEENVCSKSFHYRDVWVDVREDSGRCFWSAEITTDNGEYFIIGDDEGGEMSCRDIKEVIDEALDNPNFKDAYVQGRKGEEWIIEDYEGGDYEEGAGEYPAYIDGIPAGVFMDYDIVKRIGTCDMLDIECVREVAERLHLLDLLKYVYDIELYKKVIKNYDKAVELGVVNRISKIWGTDN